ncbi:UNVERIFIED_CONTAM: hypothetical protein Q9R58_27950 [Methylobacteriaceae bacterium AG10]|nr:hypothetical protein [Methylobacteriaceae bacterium AG10]
MQTFLIIDPATGRCVGRSSSTAPTYVPGEHEIACTPEQYAEPRGWALIDGALQAVPIAPDPVAAQQPVITFKADIWRRCTDEEAASIDEALKAAPIRQRRLFEDAQYLDHADEAFAFARTALVELFGETRAAELLAAS